MTRMYISTVDDDYHYYPEHLNNDMTKKKKKKLYSMKFRFVSMSHPKRNT